MAVVPRLVQVERRAHEIRAHGPPFDGVRRLAVVRLDRLGDVVLTLPAVLALRRAYPAVRLAFAVRAPLASIPRMVEGIDEVLPLEPGYGGIVRGLGAFGPDLVVCVSREATLAAAAARLGIAHRVGTGRRVWSPLFTRVVDEPRRDGGRHELEYALSFAHRCGATADRAVAAIEWRTEPAGSERHDLEPPFVLLHPGSGGSCPAWPVTHYVKLAEILRERGSRIAFSIGPQDGAVVTALDAASAPVRTAPRLEVSLPVWAAVARRARAVIGNSTGPLHLAAALGTTAIGFYPPWSTCSATRWGPYSERGWAIVAHDDEALHWSSRERRARGNALMAAMSPESVGDTLGACPHFNSTA